MSDYQGSDVVSFVVGGLAGACLALLLAPRTGRETRGLVAARMREGEEVARRGLVRGRQIVVTKIREGRDIAKRSIERGQAAVKEASRSAADALRDAGEIPHS
jgi:gas vesicle protein